MSAAEGTPRDPFLDILAAEDPYPLLHQMRRDDPDLSEESVQELRDRVRAKAEDETSAYWFTSRLYDDGIIDPLDTRNMLGIALCCAAGVAPNAPHYGVFRM